MMFAKWFLEYQCSLLEFHMQWQQPLKILCRQCGSEKYVRLLPPMINPWCDCYQLPAVFARNLFSPPPFTVILHSNPSEARAECTNQNSATCTIHIAAWLLSELFWEWIRIISMERMHDICYWNYQNLRHANHSIHQFIWYFRCCTYTLFSLKAFVAIDSCCPISRHTKLTSIQSQYKFQFTKCYRCTMVNMIIIGITLLKFKQCIYAFHSEWYVFDTDAMRINMLFIWCMDWSLIKLRWF